MIPPSPRIERSALWQPPESIEEAHHLLEELRIHQAELEQQTQALLESQRESEHQARRFRHLLMSVPVAVCRINARGALVGVNEAFERLLGRPAAALEGQLLYRLGRDEAERVSLLQGVQVASSRPRHEVRQVWLNTQVQPVLVDMHFSCLPESVNVVGEWIVALIDQTRRQREHEELLAAHAALQRAHQANQELALLADRSPSAVMICDGDFRIGWVNPSFTANTGYALAEARGQHPGALLGTEAPADTPQGATDTGLGPTLQPGQPIDRSRLRLRTKHGLVYWAEVSVLPVEHHDGTVSRRIVIAQDISEHVRAETEREALLRVEASHAAKTDFLSRMSHNMRTPLNAVMGFSQLLIRGGDALTPAQCDKLQLIHQAGQQLLAFVDEALQLAQLEHEREACPTQVMDLPGLVTQCVSYMRDRAQAKGINIRLELPPLHAMGEPQRTREILDNLLSNAIKYTHGPADIWVRLAPGLAPGQVSIQVQDSGVGIALIDQPLIFLPFTRLETTSAMAAGHGMGLAIARRLAQLMHGSLTLQSAPGQGSTFTLSLPAHMGPLPAPLAEAATPATDWTLPSLRVLCVEDNAMNRLLIESVFAQQPQIQLVMAPNLAIGREAALLGRPHVILLDINLPDGSGLDLCRQLRAAPPSEPAPVVIALSADALPESIALATEAGVDHYLVKPLQIQRLMGILAGLQPRH